MKNTKIEYVDHSWSPWYGCTKISPGCANCFAERWAKRFNRVQWGYGKLRRLASDAKWREPLRWNEACAPTMEELIEQIEDRKSVV